MIVGILIIVSIQSFLVWEFLNFTKKEIPALKQISEQQSAQYSLDRFMDARIANAKDQALIYLTENAMEQYLKTEFEISDDFKSFKILEAQKISETQFRFIVQINKENEIDYFVEAITLTEILDIYYIDLVEMAG